MLYWNRGGDTVSEVNFEKVLEIIGQQHGISKEQVRAEMELAMEEGMSNPDPMVQMRWKFIPRKGDKPTLEEFAEYLLRFV